MKYIFRSGLGQFKQERQVTVHHLLFLASQLFPSCTTFHQQVISQTNASPTIISPTREFRIRIRKLGLELVLGKEYWGGLGLGQCLNSGLGCR
ncbi:unnamed protein product [Rhizophagus irregularis]|nr:unnamed protein product [Rhizophagus irregularis]